MEPVPAAAPAGALPVPAATGGLGLDDSYWDDVAVAWHPRRDRLAWRSVSDAVNLRLLDRWLGGGERGSVLKTDLFDETVGEGLVPALSARFRQVCGVDVSTAVVDSVRKSFPLLDARHADVRSLPFPDASFDVVVSNSTLDHFERREEIGVAIREVHRVLRPGGSLIVTMDNPVNPVIAIRNALPNWLQRGTGLVPFRVGATYGPRRLREMLERENFDVVTVDAISHSPRVVVVLLGRLIDRFAGPRVREGYARMWVGCEGLAALPTRFLTGHFVAALARRR